MSIVQLSMAIFLIVIYNNNNLFGFKENLYRLGVGRESLGDRFKIRYESREATSIVYAYEVIVFFVVTSMFHGYYALTDNGHYNSMIKNENNYLRWIEYSISATLMIRIIALQSGIRDEKTLTSITFNTVGIMLQGQIVESILSNKVVSSKEKYIILVSTFVGWILMVSNFYIIIKQYIELNNDVNNLDCDAKVPDFVLWIIVTQLIFYSTFGFIQIVQIYRKLYKPKSYNYRNIESWYILNSLLSKITLGGILAYSVIGASDGMGGSFNCS